MSGTFRGLGIGILSPPPFKVTNYKAEEDAMKEKRYPSARRREIFPDRLSFVAKKENANDLHHNGKRTAGVQYAVNHQVPYESPFAFFGPIRRY